MTLEKQKARAAQIRSEKDAWLLGAVADPSMPKSAIKVATFISLKFNLTEAVFRWGQAGIADALGMGETTVRAALRTLEEENHLIPMSRKGPHGVTRYALNGVGSTGRVLLVEENGNRRVSAPVPANFIASNGKKEPVDRHDSAAVPLRTPVETNSEGGCALVAQQPPSHRTQADEQAEEDAGEERLSDEKRREILEEYGYDEERLTKSEIERQDHRAGFATNIATQWPTKRIR